MRSVTKVFLLGAIALAVFAAWWLQQPHGQLALAKATGVKNSAAPASVAPVAAAPAPALVEVTRARTHAVRDSVQAVGNLLSRQSTTLRPEASGRVAALHFKDGQRVRKGQLLLQLDDQLERAQLQQVDAELALAKAQFERNKELVGKGFISQAALDESAANLKVTQARRALAQTQVNRLRITAPFDAVAGIGNVHVGDYLREGDTLVQLQDMDVLYVDFRLPERLSASLRSGQTVALEFDAWPTERFAATVIAIDPLIDAQGRSVALRASLPNQELRLRPGMFARVSLTLQERNQAVLVPEQAILPDAQGAAVIRLSPWEEGDQAGGDLQQLPSDTVFRSERVAVELGLRLPGWVEVLSGIHDGDVVMVAGQHRINRSGQRARLAWVQDSDLVPLAPPGATQPVAQASAEGRQAEVVQASVTQ
ncbi:efflux RND transporter periplasmic adaptor subunit [Lampropedia puyangensis]|nr:efflux RND transporter periplasmic adaptor subunit [Lampropedia puyangensis]